MPEARRQNDQAHGISNRRAVHATILQFSAAAPRGGGVEDKIGCVPRTWFRDLASAVTGRQGEKRGMGVPRARRLPRWAPDQAARLLRRADWTPVSGVGFETRNAGHRTGPSGKPAFGPAVAPHGQSRGSPQKKLTCGYIPNNYTPWEMTDRVIPPDRGTAGALPAASRDLPATGQCER